MGLLCPRLFTACKVHRDCDCCGWRFRRDNSGEASDVQVNRNVASEISLVSWFKIPEELDDGCVTLNGNYDVLRRLTLVWFYCVHLAVGFRESFSNVVVGLSKTDIRCRFSTLYCRKTTAIFVFLFSRTLHHNAISWFSPLYYLCQTNNLSLYFVCPGSYLLLVYFLRKMTRFPSVFQGAVYSTKRASVQRKATKKQIHLVLPVLTSGL